MKIKINRLGKILGLLIPFTISCFFADTIYASEPEVTTPPFTILAANPGPINIPANMQATVTYTVINNTPNTVTIALSPTLGITQTGGNCMNVAQNASCTMNITIDANLLPAGGVSVGPTVCTTQCSKCLCSKAFGPNAFNIRVTPAVVGPPSTIYITVSAEANYIESCTINPASPTGNILPGSCQVLGIPFAAFPSMLAINPLNSILYSTDPVAPNRVYASNLDPTTHYPTNLNTAITGLASGPLGIAINSTGLRVFMSNQLDQLVQCDVNGSTISLCNTFNDALLNGPNGVALDSANSWLYVVNGNDSTVLKCPVVAGVITNPCVDSGVGNIFGTPSAIVLDESNTYAYIVNTTGPAAPVVKCEINLISGDLGACTPQNSPLFTSLIDMGINGSGKQAYLLHGNTTLSSVTICDIDQTTGDLIASTCFNPNLYDFTVPPHNSNGVAAFGILVT